MCLCVSVCMCMCVCVHVCMHTRRQETQDVFLNSFSILVLETEPSRSLEFSVLPTLAG